MEIKRLIENPVRQREIFNKILTFLEENNANIRTTPIAIPEIISMDKANSILKAIAPEGFFTSEKWSEIEQRNYLTSVINILDVLGYFSMSKPTAVFLCEELIEAHSTNIGISTYDLEEVVYIHECAHYLHYHLNSGNFRNCPFDANDTGDRSLYVETFAQLLTHVISHKLSNKHFEVFNELKKGQLDFYTAYNKATIACCKDYLLNLFLNPQLAINTNIIELINVDYDCRRQQKADEFNSPWDLKGLVRYIESLIRENNSVIDRTNSEKIAKFLCPHTIQRLIDNDPTKMIMELSPIWSKISNVEPFVSVIYPPSWSIEPSLASDLKDIGL
jgi:hypothetical protein